MQAFELAELLKEQTANGKLYHEFLRVPDMSMGIYRLAVGAEDLQQPHKQDEVYYIISGKAQITIAEEVQPVEAGSIVYVAANVDHRFHDIREDLTTLVFFAPAEKTS